VLLFFLSASELVVTCCSAGQVDGVAEELRSPTITAVEALAHRCTQLEALVMTQQEQVHVHPCRRTHAQAVSSQTLTAWLVDRTADAREFKFRQCNTAVAPRDEQPARHVLMIALMMMWVQP
jgi:hypothetical protein